MPYAIGISRDIYSKWYLLLEDRKKRRKGKKKKARRLVDTPKACSAVILEESRSCWVQTCRNGVPNGAPMARYSPYKASTCFTQRTDCSRSRPNQKRFNLSRAKPIHLPKVASKPGQNAPRLQCLSLKPSLLDNFSRYFPKATVLTVPVLTILSISS